MGFEVLSLSKILIERGFPTHHRKVMEQQTILWYSIFQYKILRISDINEKEGLLRVGKYNSKFNEILGIDIKDYEIYRSKGLPSHMIKRKHFSCLKYIDYIPDIILKPDYIGVNPNEQGLSVELIKKYADNVLIGIKLDAEGEYLYVSTMHDVQETKISRRLHSGRIKVFSVDNEERE